MFITEGEHTVICPKEGDLILDIGCRHFTFSKAMQSRGCICYALEPDANVKAPEGIQLYHDAIAPQENSGKASTLIMWSSGEGNHLDSISGGIPESHTTQEVRCISIVDISKHFNVTHWDIVKMDCEGSEYRVLLDWPGPIATQIAIEFHDFTGANPEGEEMHKRIIEHLSQWYYVVRHEKDERCAAKVTNYWDSLFVLKGTPNV